MVDLWSKFKSYNETIRRIKKSSKIPKRLKPRLANFPEFISQYFVFKVLRDKLKRGNVVLNVTGSCADLFIDGKIAEVKAGVNGPSTLTIQGK